MSKGNPRLYLRLPPGLIDRLKERAGGTPQEYVVKLIEKDLGDTTSGTKTDIKPGRVTPPKGKVVLGRGVLRLGEVLGGLDDCPHADKRWFSAYLECKACGAKIGR